jgi:Fe-S-cluster containining protein
MDSMTGSEAYQDGNECQRCGACCVTYRVSFHWMEATLRGLPDGAVQRLDPRLVCMTGTNQTQPRCLFLEGEVGQSVRCAVYSQRPTPCREMQPGDEKCNRARARHGLPALSGR